MSTSVGARQRAQTVADRPQDRQRADAEQEAGGDEAFGEGAGFLGWPFVAPAQPLTDGLQPVLDADQLADHPAGEKGDQGEEHVRVFGACWMPMTKVISPTPDSTVDRSRSGSRVAEAQWKT